MKHESNLILYDGAKEMLRRSGIDLKTLDIDKIRSDYALLERQKNEIGMCIIPLKKSLNK